MSSKSSTPRSGTPRATTPRSSPTKARVTPPKSTTPVQGLIRDQGNHSLSMCGAERYKNQLHTTANTELFSKQRARTMYRRPSELGMSTKPMEDKSEAKRNYDAKSIGRGHIVKPIPDHLETYHAAVEEWKEELIKDTESKAHYKNLQAKRPICNKIADHLKMEGEIEKDSLAKSSYTDLKAKRPIIHKLIDHDDQIQANEPMQETSEYRSTINKLENMALKGERALPAWLGVQKVTPFGTDHDQTRE
jgi:hypothetical protein